MPFISYQELKNKGSLASSQIGDARVFLNGLNAIDKDKNSVLYGQLKKYVDAFAMVTSNAASKRREQQVKESIEVLKSFPEFLLSGENKTVYQEIVDAAGSGNYEDFAEAEFKKGLQIYEKHLGMEIDYDAISQKQEEFDQINEMNNIADDAVVYDLDDFRKKVRKGNSFVTDRTRQRNFDGMQSVIRSAVNELQSSIDAIEARKEKFKSYRPGDAENIAETQALIEKLNGYNRTFDTLKNVNKNDGLYQSVEEANRSNAIREVYNFKNYLDEGEFETNYQKIVSLAAKNQKKQPQEVRQQFKNGLNELNHTFRYGIAPEAAAIKANERAIERDKKIQLENQRKAEKHDANIWIEHIQGKLKQNDMTKEEGFARIMAARLLVDSGRNNLYSLKKSVTNFDLTNKTDELLKNPQYKAFINKVTGNEKLLAKATKAATTGHGGGLDDMFKTYLLKRPAGELNNDPALDRYMPKAIDRIEELQSQAKKHKNDNPNAEAAEILCIRNMVKAERNAKESLDVKIPVTGENLKENVAALEKNQAFTYAFGDPRVKAAIGKGHGGLMVNGMRKINNLPKEQKMLIENDPVVDRALNAGTVDGRLNDIRKEAETVREKLQTSLRRGEDVYDLVKAGKDLIYESLSLSILKEKAKNKETIGNENIPWKKLNNMKDEFSKNEEVNGVLFPNSQFRGPDIVTKLDQLNKLKPAEFDKQFTKDIQKNKGKLKAENMKNANVHDNNIDVGEVNFEALSQQMGEVYKNLNSKQKGMRKG